MTVWKTKNTYIDVDTGEIISKEEANKNYRIINKIKITSHEDKRYAGIIEYTNECRKNKYTQQRIGFT